MLKTLYLALKDIRITFRDRAALLIMFALPLALTMISFFAFGGSAGEAAPEAIPLVIFNQDEGSLGGDLIAVFQSDDLSGLLLPEVVTSEVEARRAVEEDRAAAAVLIPGDFSSSLSTHALEGQTSTLTILANPTRTISAVVVQSVASRFTEIINTTTVGMEASFTQLIKTGRIDPNEVSNMAPAMGEAFGSELSDSSLITIEYVEPEPVEEQVFSFNSLNYLEYYAASMAVLGLMFTLTGSARSILSERENSTLDRFRTTPSTSAEFIGGKVLSTLFTGFLQMAVLISVTTLLLDAQWGALAPLAVFSIVLVAAVAAMGMLIAAFARSHAQAGMLGTAVTLVLGAASGNFLPRAAFPQWLQTISLLGPSAWGIEGYQALAAGASFEQLGTSILALASMTVVFFLLAIFGLRRNMT